MSHPLDLEIQGDVLEVVLEEERVVLELWAGLGGGGGGSGDATSIQGFPVSTTDPTTGQALVYDGDDYVPTDIATQAELAAHIANQSNPHAVTAAQVGAYTTAAVDALLAGKSDVGHTHTFASLTSKPTTLAGYGITDAALDADLDAHTARTDNPHAVTKTQVGLGDVENTALSTWAGSTAITTLGTIVTGTVPAARVSAGAFGAGEFQMTSLILDQGALDDRIFSLRSSDVSHGYTTAATTTAFANFSKATAIGGGLLVNALSDVSIGADDQTLVLAAYSHSDFNNTNTNATSSRSIVEFHVAQHDGANALVDFGGTENIFGVRKYIVSGGALRTVLALDANGLLKLFGGADTSVGNGAIFLNDTSNANMFEGITLRLAAGHAQAVCLKGAQIATGATTLPLSVTDIETDDWCILGQIAAATGGLHMVAIAESTIAVAAHFEFWSGAPATTDTSSSLGICNFFVGQHDGANADADIGADGNAFAWGEIDSAGARQTRMLLKADDGELHLGNTTLVALDHEDDLQAVRALQVVRTDGRGIVPSRFDRPAYDFAALHALGVVGDRDENGDFLIRVQPYLNLHDGALWQLHTRTAALEEAFRYLVDHPDDGPGALRLLEA